MKTFSQHFQKKLWKEGVDQRMHEGSSFVFAKHKRFEFSKSLVYQGSLQHDLLSHKPTESYPRPVTAYLYTSTTVVFTVA